MKKASLLLLLSVVLFQAYSCKKCTTCIAVDTSGHTFATQKYCSTSWTNLNTFEKSWKTTYGAAASCKRN